jgi:hypothetical protein
VFEYSGEAVPEYGVRNTEFYDYLSEIGLQISTLDRWLRGGPPLERSAFPERRARDGEWDWMYVAYDRERWPTPTAAI